VEAVLVIEVIADVLAMEAILDVVATSFVAVFRIKGMFKIF